MHKLKSLLYKNLFLDSKFIKSILKEIDEPDSMGWTDKLENKNMIYAKNVIEHLDKIGQYKNFNVYQAIDNFGLRHVNCFIQKGEEPTIVYFNCHKNYNNNYIEQEVWKYDKCTSLKASTILFDYYAPNYSKLISDLQMTDDGIHYWISNIKEALNKNYKIRFTVKYNNDKNDNHIYDLKQGDNEMNNIIKKYNLNRNMLFELLRSQISLSKFNLKVLKIIIELN